MHVQAIFTGFALWVMTMIDPSGGLGSVAVDIMLPYFTSLIRQAADFNNDDNVSVCIFLDAHSL